MNEWENVQMNEWEDEQKNERINEQMNEKLLYLNEQPNEQTDKKIITFTIKWASYPSFFEMLSNLNEKW